ncbi:MBL fold metallo-hydrolase [Bacillus sp. FJAT-47783]|uniref:MBL fold metallo-hydrolase n=1 Tax=Bacillus sp. FJAT-47783 TaxID=2922712 RepID=UPI001FAC2A34|nr:MBL fold metallo-hydrolase [Bacillus sp. FJAT-47783]
MMNTLKPSQITMLSLPTPFPVGDVNVYLIKGDALTLVDAGPKTDEAWSRFQSQLYDHGYNIEDIDQVVLTHHHPDHIGLLDYLPHDIPVYGASYNAPWLRQEKSFLGYQKQFYSELFTLFGVDQKHEKFLSLVDMTYHFSCHRSLSKVIQEGDTIDGLLNWTVLETPGHAQSHIVLYNERTNEVIGGDHLLKKISSNPLLEPPLGSGERPKPQLQYNTSLKKLLDFPISIVYPGHGEFIYEAHTLIRHRLQRQHERAMNVLELIDKQEMTAFQICQKLFPTVYERELMLTMSETVGQLDYLIDLQLLTSTNEDGVLLYRRV